MKTNKYKRNRYRRNYRSSYKTGRWHTPAFGNPNNESRMLQTLLSNLHYSKNRDILRSQTFAKRGSSFADPPAYSYGGNFAPWVTKRKKRKSRRYSLT